MTRPDTRRATGAGVDELAAAALAYAAAGWHVFPLRPGDKRPAFPDHGADTCTQLDRTHHTDRATSARRQGRRSDPRCARAGRHVTWEERATTDPDRIRAAWARAPFGVGIACGPSGLLVVDLDVPKPGTVLTGRWAAAGIVDGADVLAVLAGDHHQPVPFDTRTVRTPSGGTHLYFDQTRAGVELGNTAGALGPLIDTRGRGGYVVAPPTRLRLDATAPGGAGYVVDDPAAAVAALPAWLADLLRPRPTPPPLAAAESRAGGDGSDQGDQGERSVRYAAAALDRTVAVLLEATPGTRNRTLYGAAVSLGRLVAGGALDDTHTAAVLAAAAASIGLPADEAAATIRSGLRAGARQPRTPPNHPTITTGPASAGPDPIPGAAA